MNDEIRFALYCYNDAPKLLEALKVMTGKAGSWHCVVIDDGSADNSGILIKKFVDTDSRFRYVFQQHQGKDVALAAAKQIFNHEDITFTDVASLLKETSTFISTPRPADTTDGSIQVI